MLTKVLLLFSTVKLHNKTQMISNKKLKVYASALFQEFFDNDNTIEIVKRTSGLFAKTKPLLSLLQNDTFADEIIEPDHLFPNISISNLSDNDSFGSESPEPTKQAQWIDKYLPHFNETYHLKIETFYALLNEIQDDVTLFKMYTDTKCLVPLENGLLLTIWYLAKGTSIPDIHEKFDYKPSTILKVTDIVLKIIVALQTKYISWPDENESEETADKFLENFGYLDVIGVIGTAHVNFKPPFSDEELYRNKNMGYSIILQGICNSENEFINIFTGLPGALDSKTVLTNSLLYKEIEKSGKHPLFYDKYHLVGDESYPLRSWLMTPFRNNERLYRKHVKHNHSLNLTLETLKKTFKLLQGRWRVLNFVNTSSINKITVIITSCCVLHNFCIRHCDQFDDMLKEYEKNLKKIANYSGNSRLGESKREKNLSTFM